MKRAVVILAAVLGPCFGMSAHANDWYDVYVAREAAIGGNYYQSPNSATLAWNESYILESYVRMYALSKQTVWLDKLVTHFDAMMSNTRHLDGSAYSGWDTSNYAMDRTTNFGAATPAGGDASTPSGWSRFQCSSATCYRGTQAGEYLPADSQNTAGFVVKTGGVDGVKWHWLQQGLTGYQPLKTYTLRFYGKTNGGPASGRALVKDVTTGQILVQRTFNNTAWNSQPFEDQFVMPVGGHDVQVLLGHSDYTASGLTAYFDLVEVQQQTRYLVHTGMIARPIVEFVQLVRSTPALQAAYLAKANSYLAFVQGQLLPEWDAQWREFAVGQATGGAFVMPPDDSFDYQGCVLPHNQYLGFANLLLRLSQVDGTNATYVDRPRKMASYFLDRVRNTTSSHPGAYNWHYIDQGLACSYSESKSEDTGHGSIDADFVSLLWSANIASSPLLSSDVPKFAATLNSAMWTPPSLTYFVDGSNSGTNAYGGLPNSWGEFAAFDPHSWDIETAMLAAPPSTGATYLNSIAELLWWDPQRVANWGFEQLAADDKTLPARWQRWQSTSATAYVDANAAYSGRYGVTIATNGTSWQRLKTTPDKWVAGAPYVLSFYGKTNGQVGGRVYVRNDVTNQMLKDANGQACDVTFTDMAWQQFSCRFVAPAAGDTFSVWLGHSAYAVQGGTASFDEVRIRREDTDPIF